MNHHEVSNTELSEQIDEILEAVTSFTNPDKITKEICDDNGEPFKTQDGAYIPNNKFDLDGCHYETDDNGTIYKANGEYYPNDWFVVNGEFFQTDENGELIKDSSEGKKGEFVKHEPRTTTLPDGTASELPDPAIYSSQENSKATDVNDVPDELCDDNGKQYRTEDGGWVPNNTYVLDEVTYKTDDNGNIYSIDGKLQPNTTYELNGNIYITDENGRIISCEAKPVRSPENPRDNEAQRQAGGEDRRPNDQGGHIVGRDMNGDGGIGNLVAMDSKINQSDYKRMENDIKAALDEGKEVTTKTEMTYSGDSERPDKITVTVTADGKDTVYEFDNNLDGSLDDEVSEEFPSEKAILEEHPDVHVSSAKREYDENGNLVKTTVCELDNNLDGSLDKEISEKSPSAKAILADHPGAHASSVKREYDEDGTLIKTTAYITWTDEDGNKRRRPIIVPNE